METHAHFNNATPYALIQYQTDGKKIKLRASETHHRTNQDHEKDTDDVAAGENLACASGRDVVADEPRAEPQTDTYFGNREEHENMHER